jgi:hypothetical protein
VSWPLRESSEGDRARSPGEQAPRSRPRWRIARFSSSIASAQSAALLIVTATRLPPLEDDFSTAVENVTTSGAPLTQLIEM